MKKQQIFKDWPHIAHRGLHDKKIPENTLKSFQKAIDNHYAIELDVHLTKDHQVVVFHDDQLMRMTGEKKKIKDTTLVELQKLKLLHSNYKIPLLYDVLQLIHGQVPILIELKYDQKRGKLEKKLIKILKNYNGIYYFQSFRFSSIWYMKRKMKTKVGILIHKKDKNRIFPSWIYHLFQIDFISYPISCYPNKKLNKIAEKIPVLFWTITQETKKIPSYHDGIIFENKSCEIKKNIL